MPKSIFDNAVERGVIADVSTQDDMHTIKSFKLDVNMATSEECDALFERLPQRTFAELVDDLQFALKERLVELGWPDPAEAVLHKGKKWRLKPANLNTAEQWKDLVGPGEKLSAGWAYTLSESPKLGEAWFNAKLYKCILQVLAHDGASRDLAIFMLAHTCAMAQSRGLLGDVKRGKATRRAASSGGSARAKAKALEQAGVLRAMKSIMENGHSITRSADLAFKKGHGTSASANRSAWYRSQKRH